MLPQIRKWLERLNRLREDLQRYEKRLSGLTEQGNDIGGETVNNWIRALADMQEMLAEFQRRQIFIKDLERGLLDFPAIIGGKEVFLCWESGRGRRGILARSGNRLRRTRTALKFSTFTIHARAPCARIGAEHRPGTFRQRRAARWSN